MPGYLYTEAEVLERKSDVRVMGNGTVTAGAKYIDNPDVRVDVIIVKRTAYVQRINSKFWENGCAAQESHEINVEKSPSSSNALISRPTRRLL